MASVMALELVNRTRLFRRLPPVTAIATDEDTAALNALNTAIENILGTRKWDFDLRHDGQLSTRASLDVDSVGFSAGATTGSLINASTFVTADLSGDYVTRLVITGNSNYAETPFRVTSHTSTVTTLAVVKTAVAVPELVSGVAGKLVYSEYTFPDTVRSIVRTSHQEEDLALEDISPTTRFEEWIPNSSMEEGPPEIFAVGGYDNPTFVTGETVVPALRAIIWPVPDDEYVINYSYYYRHPELTAATSTLVGVPPEVVNDIVEEATSFMGIVWDADYAMSHLSDRAQAQAGAKHRSGAPGRNRRYSVDAWGSGSTAVTIEPGFPGKVIG